MTRSATMPSRAMSASDEPPNFWTTIGMLPNVATARPLGQEDRQSAGSGRNSGEPETPRRPEAPAVPKQALDAPELEREVGVVGRRQREDGDGGRYGRAGVDLDDE